MEDNSNSMTTNAVVELGTLNATASEVLSAIQGLSEIAALIDQARDSVEIAIGTLGAKDSADLETRKLAAIAKCKAKLTNLQTLFEEGELSREEYFSKRDRVRQEVQQWEQTNTESAQIAVELMQCIEALNRVHTNWEVADNDEKQEIVRGLFEEVIYDLDTQQITDFQLKPWAQRYLVLRSALYGMEKGIKGDKGKQKPISEYFQEMGTLMTPTGRRGARQYLRNWWPLSTKSSLQFNSNSKLSRLAIMGATQF